METFHYRECLFPINSKILDARIIKEFKTEVMSAFFYWKFISLLIVVISADSSSNMSLSQSELSLISPRISLNVSSFPLSWSMFVERLESQNWEF